SGTRSPSVRKGHGPDAISSLLDVARVATHALEDGTFRVELSVFAPLTGVLLTLSLKPQCSHSIQIRVERKYQFHVGLPHRGQISGWSGRIVRPSWNLV